jgi:hypothetical protein
MEFFSGYELVRLMKQSSLIFLVLGDWKTDMEIPQTTLEDSVARLEGEEENNIGEGMRQWRPEQTKFAAQLVSNPCLGANGWPGL